MSSKLRSIKAFRDFELKRSSTDVEVDSHRVVSLLRESEKGMRKREIAERLDAPVEAVESAVVTLLEDDAVTIERASRSEDDLVRL